MYGSISVFCEYKVQYIVSILYVWSTVQWSTVRGLCARSHRNLELVQKVRDALHEHGIPTWFDMDDITDKNIDSMTRGIVNAKVVLLCFSQSYKSSYYCKQEALYANKKGKMMVPVRVQDKYNPSNDWLDFIVGDNLIIDVATQELFKQNMPKVCDNIVRIVMYNFSIKYRRVEALLLHTCSIISN